jgi:hypothetical protein
MSSSSREPRGGSREGLLVALTGRLAVAGARFAVGIDVIADVIRAPGRVKRIRSEVVTPPFSRNKTGGDVIARGGTRFLALESAYLRSERSGCQIARERGQNSQVSRRQAACGAERGDLFRARSAPHARRWAFGDIVDRELRREPSCAFRMSATDAGRHLKPGQTWFCELLGRHSRCL